MYQTRLCLDLGSSETKLFNLGTSERATADNSIATVPVERDLSDYYSEGSMKNNLDMTVSKLDGQPITLTLPDVELEKGIVETFQDRYIIGELARQYTPVLTVPDSKRQKTFQQTTYMSIISNLVAEAIKAGVDETEAIAGVLLPPREYLDKEIKGLFVKNIAGDYAVTLNSFDKTVKLHIPEKNIVVYSECAAGLATFVFNINGQKREEAKNYADGNVLAIDVGKSTTDIALIREHRPIVGSYFTIPFGGEMVADLLVQGIRDKFKTDRPNDKAIERAIKTGLLKQGARDIPVHDLLMKAKRGFVQSFWKEFMGYMTVQRYSPQDIAALLFVGGGTLPTTDGVVPSSGKFIAERFRELSQYTDDLYLEDARFANLEGMRRRMIAMGNVG